MVLMLTPAGGAGCCSTFYVYKLFYVGLNFLPMLIFGDPAFAPGLRAMLAIADAVI